MFKENKPLYLYIRNGLYLVNVLLTGSEALMEIIESIYVTSTGFPQPEQYYAHNWSTNRGGVGGGGEGKVRGVTVANYCQTVRQGVVSVVAAPEDCELASLLKRPVSRSNF